MKNEKLKMRMLYKEKTEKYDPEIYGRPWIAKLSLGKNEKIEYKFGRWVGKNGGEGRFEIYIEFGEVFAIGQKCHENRKQTKNLWYVFRGDPRMPHKKYPYDLLKKSEALDVLRGNDKSDHVDVDCETEVLA